MCLWVGTTVQISQLIFFPPLDKEFSRALYPHADRKSYQHKQERNRSQTKYPHHLMGLITPRESDVGAEEYQSPALGEDLMLSSRHRSGP